MTEGGPGVESRLLVAFTNKFLSDSVAMLNTLCVTAERRMAEIMEKIHRLEDSLGKYHMIPSYKLLFVLLFPDSRSIYDICRYLGG